MSVTTLDVILRYKGAKASQLAPGLIQETQFLDIVKDTLYDLGAPFPKTGDFYLLSTGTVLLSWTGTHSSLKCDYLLHPMRKRYFKLSQNLPELSRARENHMILSIAVAERPQLIANLKIMKSKINQAKIASPSATPSHPPSTPSTQVAPASGPSHPQKNVQAGPSSLPPTPKRPAAADFHGPETMIRNPSLPSVKGPSIPVQHNLPSSQSATVPVQTESKVDQLLKELERVRTLMQRASAGEGAVLSALRSLGVDPPVVVPPACNPDSRQTCEHQVQLSVAEEALKSERRRRECAEQLVRDVEKECKEPFVVPALLQAFVDISRLADEAGNHLRTESS